ncbi:hypothetical protein H4582DRAFT_1929904 [Lactarius indigo]|nr:hypothetical protein H4582DRAFT_1929904 [Lactarius indigo]
MCHASSGYRRRENHYSNTFLLSPPGWIYRVHQVFTILVRKPDIWPCPRQWMVHPRTRRYSPTQQRRLDHVGVAHIGPLWRACWIAALGCGTSALGGRFNGLMLLRETTNPGTDTRTSALGPASVLLCWLCERKQMWAEANSGALNFEGAPNNTRINETCA